MPDPNVCRACFGTGKGLSYLRGYKLVEPPCVVCDGTGTRKRAQCGCACPMCRTTHCHGYYCSHVVEQQEATNDA